MVASIPVVFAIVYVGMMLGGLPGLALDRTGIALLGAIAVVVIGAVSPTDAWTAIDVTTIGLLLGLMILSAQFRLGGFYTWFTQRLAAFPCSPQQFLAVVIFAAGGLSALLCNDVICLAMAPILAESCGQRRLNPVPYLLGLACAANIGSAGTLIGNPQNMLIGQVLQLRFDAYLLQASIPTLLGLVLTWLVIAIVHRGQWHAGRKIEPSAQRQLNRWQTAKALIALTALTVLLLFGTWPRELVALAIAGTLLLSRRMASGEILELVDWHLLVLFSGLFVINHAMETSGYLQALVDWLEHHQVVLEDPTTLFVASAVLSNLVSNVPATMLLLPSATHPLAGPALALSSTLAGNMLVVGSIANMIVIDQAKRLGIAISWWEHARVGVPITLATLVTAAAWLKIWAMFLAG
ncbi:MAG: anion transporter [Pirellulaceae bacterium]|nr:MAG: anion transporter [Pirellulaceae bacterium]